MISLIERTLRNGYRKTNSTHANVGGDQVLSILVDDLVTGKETQDVGVRLEGLDDTKDLLEVDGVVRGPRLTAVERAIGQRRVDIQNDIDTGTVEVRDTLVVVERGLQVVNTDGVDLYRIISH